MTVVAFAGRRIDAVSADTTRFPLGAVDAVAARIRDRLIALDAEALVASAAAGADLLALREAGALGLRRRVVLPMPRAEFLERSVCDRPGDWAPLFHEVVDEVDRRGDLVILDVASGHEEFLVANDAILAEARALAAARAGAVAAIVAWDLRSRGKDDVTDAFRRRCLDEKVPVYEIDTAAP